MNEVNKIVSLKAMYMTPCIFPNDLTRIKVNRPSDKISNLIDLSNILSGDGDKTFHFLSGATPRFVLNHEANAIDQVDQDEWTSQNPSEKAH